MKVTNVRAGAKFPYELALKDKRNVSRMVEAGTAEFVLTLPPGVSVASLKAAPASKVKFSTVPAGGGGGSSAVVNGTTYVWRLQAGGKHQSTMSLSWLKLRLWLVVDPCAPSSSTTIEAAFYPLGRSVLSCSIGAGRAFPMAITADPAKCKAAQGGGKKKSGNAYKN